MPIHRSVVHTIPIEGTTINVSSQTEHIRFRYSRSILVSIYARRKMNLNALGPGRRRSYVEAVNEVTIVESNGGLYSRTIFRKNSRRRKTLKEASFKISAVTMIRQIRLNRVVAYILPGYVIRTRTVNNSDTCISMIDTERTIFGLCGCRSCFCGADNGEDTAQKRQDKQGDENFA